MCSFGLQFIFSFSTQPFYKNYWMLDSHTNTIFHTVVYQTPYFTQLSTLKDGFQNRDEVLIFQIYSVFMGLLYVLGFSIMDLEMSLAVWID